MTNWTIVNGLTTETVTADLTPTFVIKWNGDTYVTILTQKLPGNAVDNPRAFYEGQYNSAETIPSLHGTARKINTADERAQSVNVVNITR
jgi:hypothetical protein